VIVGDRTAEELFEYLAVEVNFVTFEHHLQQFTLRPPLGNLGTFKELLTAQRPRLLDLVARIRSGQQRAIDQLASAIGAANQAMIDQPLEQLHVALLAAGFSVTMDRLQQMKAFALRGRDQKQIEQLLAQPEVLGAVVRHTSIEPKDVNFDRLAAWADAPSDAHWLHSVLRDVGATHVPEPERIHRLLAEHRHERHLSQVAGDKPPAISGAIWGLSARSQWLIVLSFLVCMVGVANAMLMSVTERFTEIATMKCLGAMDRFVMMMFVLEALIQGAAGGAVGLLLGVILALVRGAFEFGRLLSLASGATPTVLLAMLLSLGVTMILAALSAVGPAYVAARLSPMEAMRVE
jgi:putative ABC transport system permease protein